jgi:hypothetical protein
LAAYDRDDIGVGIAGAAPDHGPCMEEPMAESDDSRERRLAYGRAYYAANREQLIAYSKEWNQTNKARRLALRRARYANHKERDALYAWRAANPEKFAYFKHRQDAKERGVPFLMTFEEWWSIWDTSGKWPLRGCRKGQYVMARFGDEGGYEAGNVRICTSSENVSERHEVERRRRANHGAGSSCT